MTEPELRELAKTVGFNLPKGAISFEDTYAISMLVLTKKEGHERKIPYTRISDRIPEENTERGRRSAKTWKTDTENLAKLPHRFSRQDAQMALGKCRNGAGQYCGHLVRRKRIRLVDQIGSMKYFEKVEN
ncbi:MAG: hypothetical protein AAFR21_11525 [Pseudomonadota bacterium]